MVTSQGAGCTAMSRLAAWGGLRTCCNRARAVSSLDFASSLESTDHASIDETCALELGKLCLSLQKLRVQKCRLR